MQDAKVTGAANPPFATKDGQPANQGQSASGAHDFVRDPKGSAASTGGRDFTRESRPQSEARPEVAGNPQEIPAGGAILKADPGPVSVSVSGTAAGPQPASPMKLHNGMGGSPAAARGGPGASGSGSSGSGSRGSGSSETASSYSGSRASK